MDRLATVEKVPDNLYVTAEILEDYGVEVRYSGDWNLLNAEDIREAHQAAIEIKEFVKDKLDRRP
jgi:CheY-like chemotaxis protein